MDKVCIEVLQLQVLESLFESLGHLGGLMGVVPEFRRDPDRVPIAAPPLNAGADLRLVLVDGGRICQAARRQAQEAGA